MEHPTINEALTRYKLKIYVVVVYINTTIYVICPENLDEVSLGNNITYIYLFIYFP